MKNKFFMAIAVIMVTGTLMMSATAQIGNVVSGQVSRVGTAVYLQPDVSGLTGDFFTFNVINNTNQTIPAGTKIYWSLGTQVKGSKVLSAPLAPGKKIFLDSGANQNTGAPKAWFLK
jgi:hypothetical protein